MKISLTTLLGVLYGVVATMAIDWWKVFDLDRHEIARLAGAVIVGLLGKYGADRPAAPPGEPEKRETKGVPPGEDPLAGEPGHEAVKNG